MDVISSGLHCIWEIHEIQILLCITGGSVLDQLHQVFIVNDFSVKKFVSAYKVRNLMKAHCNNLKTFSLISVLFAGTLLFHALGDFDLRDGRARPFTSDQRIQNQRFGSLQKSEII